MFLLVFILTCSELLYRGLLGLFLETIHLQMKTGTFFFSNAGIISIMTCLYCQIDLNEDWIFYTWCSYIQRLLDRISNGTLPDDRRNAIVELQSVVAESNAAQLAFGASGKCLFFFFLLCV